MKSVFRIITHNFKDLWSHWMLIAIFMGMGFINACDTKGITESTYIDSLQSSSKILKVGLISPSLSMFQSSNFQTHDLSGLELEYLQQFSHFTGIKLVYLSYNDVNQLKKDLSSKKIDLAILRGPSGWLHDSEFFSGPIYEHTSLSLFCRRADQIENLNDLKKLRVTLHPALNDEQLISELNQEIPSSTNLVLTENASTQQLFSDLAWNRTDCLITENLEGLYYSKFFKTVEKVNFFDQKLPLRFLYLQHKKDLRNIISYWFQISARSENFSKIRERYEYYLEDLTEKDVIQFQKDFKNKLPDYKKFFIQASEKFKIPWQWIAAVSYQESHWNHEARSFTGVRGLMQLTEETAERLGIKNRRDPQESVWGGTEYLKMIYNKIPPQISTKDRWALSLVAYNLGWGHLKDAQRIAQAKHKNPYLWKDIKSVLPLLNDPAYSKLQHYGPARGEEAIEFVDRVRVFHHLLISSK